jgi:hypothetical protein
MLNSATKWWIFGKEALAARASFFYPKEDPNYASCPILQSLGETA